MKLAWRNLWRNKRRTLITMASVFLAVLLALSMRSLQKGSYANMINNAVRFSTGYIQIHAKGYWDKPTINNSFQINPEMKNLLSSESNISLAVPRLESFVLASSGDHSKGTQIIGIDPKKEDILNNISDRVVAGHFFTEHSHEILIGDGLSKYLNVGVGDSLVLLGQGYQGVTAAGQFRVGGVFHFPDNRMNNSLAYLTLETAGDLFAAPGNMTSISLMLDKPSNLNNTKHFIEKHLDTSQWEVMSWDMMNKTMTQEIAADNSGGIIMLGILYVVIAFGVFGTVLMMTVERRKEFAVMAAIGMRRTQMVWLLLIETLFIGLIAVFAGLIVSVPVLAYLKVNPIRITGTASAMFEQFGIEPIMPASLSPDIFINQGIAVFFISLIASIYPLIYVGKLNVLRSLKD